MLDLQSSVEWQVNTGDAHPMMSVFKAPVAATILSRISGGSLSLQQKVTINRAEVQDGAAISTMPANWKAVQPKIARDDRIG